MNCTAVRVRAEFDVDIEHDWSLLKWWDSFHCSLVSAVEPHKCPERAYAYDYGRAVQPRIKVDIRAHPPKQQPAPDAEPMAARVNWPKHKWASALSHAITLRQKANQ